MNLLSFTEDDIISYKRNKIIKVKYELSAILMKELLTLTVTNESHIKCMNELVKLFQFLTPCDKWLDDLKTRSVIKRILLILKKDCQFDRINKKYFNDFITSFQQLKEIEEDDSNNHNNSEKKNDL